MNATQSQRAGLPVVGNTDVISARAEGIGIPVVRAGRRLQLSSCF
jgi:hypothetical protein